MHLSRLAIAVGLVSVSCGGSQVVPSGGSVEAPRAAGVKSEDVVIGDRTAEVPAATNPQERIVFLRAGSVWMMGADGSEPTQLTARAEDAPDEHPALSPDGTRVAFVSARDGQRRIYVLSLEELIAEPVTDGADGGDSEPAWSPDSKSIAFSRGDGRLKKDIYVLDPVTGNLDVMLLGEDDLPEQTGHPAWSPDGRTIAVSADRRDAKGTHLWLIDVQSRELRRVTPIKSRARYLIDREPAWSPDGSLIVFASNRHVSSADDAGDFDVYAIRPDGSGLTRLTDDPGVAMSPTYSSDGKRLYFASSRHREKDYEWELYVMAATGGKQQRVTRDERPQNSDPSLGITK
jgi:Tol biopolymer transport system component